MKKSSNNKNIGQGAEKSAENFNDLYYDKQEVLQLFHISSRTLQEWRDQNLITYFRIGHKSYYLKESINKFIADRTVSAKTNSSSEKNIEKEAVRENDKDLLTDTVPSKTPEGTQTKLVAKVWDPIPGFLLPILVIFIYFIPYAPNIIRGETIDLFYLVLPLMVGIIGGTAFIIFQLAIKISKKYITPNNSQKLGENNNHSY